MCRIKTRLGWLLVWFSAVWLAVACPADADDAPIDALLEQAHRSAGVQARPVCSDAVFLRRVTLDLAGRVPTLAELATLRGDFRRVAAVERLLESEEFDQYWAQLWTNILIGRRQDNRTDRESLRRWLEHALADRQPLDQIAFDLMSAQGVTSLDGAVNFLVANREDPVTPVSRVFLGVQLDCARCHDHPYDRWSQTDYANMKRFFEPVQFRDVSGGARVLDVGARDVGTRDGGTRTDGDLPRFLTGARPGTAAWRKELALMTVRSWPFARAMGNRVWQLLMGRGLVHPVDGLSNENPASVPALHQALAEQLRTQGFDLRQLIRTICISDAYARTVMEPSDALRASIAHERHYELFAARRPRPLLPEQWVLSYHRMIFDERLTPQRLNQRAIEWLGRASATSGASDPLSVFQNSQGLLSELAIEVSAPHRDIDSLFQCTLSRAPDAGERKDLSEIPSDDLFYALLHCNEFIFSH